MRLAWDRITWLAIRPWLSSHTTSARAACSFKMRRPSSVDVARRILALQGSRACSSSSLSRGSVEISSKIGGCILFRSPCQPPGTGNSLLLFLPRKQGGLGGPASCLLHVVLLRNPYVAKEAALFRSFEGALLERARKTLLVDLSQRLKARSKSQGGRGEGGFIRRVCPKIEGADIQAIVASKDAITHLSSEVVGNDFSTAAKLDGQIGNTEAGIDDIGFDDGAGWTSLNTEGAASAEICGRFILLQFQRRQNLPEQEP